MNVMVAVLLLATAADPAPVPLPDPILMREAARSAGVAATLSGIGAASLFLVSVPMIGFGTGMTLGFMGAGGLSMLFLGLPGLGIALGGVAGMITGGLLADASGEWSRIRSQTGPASVASDLLPVELLLRASGTSIRLAIGGAVPLVLTSAALGILAAIPLTVYGRIPWDLYLGLGIMGVALSAGVLVPAVALLAVAASEAQRLDRILAGEDPEAPVRSAQVLPLIDAGPGRVRGGLTLLF